VLSRFRTLLAALWRRRRWEDDLREELESHVRHQADDLVRQGVSPDEASRRARIELGPRETWREGARAAFGLRWIDELRQDVIYTVRTLRRSPGFALVALLSLALGVGANTVVFSIVNTVVLRPPPIAAPDQVSFLQSSFGPTWSFPNYLDLRDRNTSLTGLAAYRFAPMALGGERGTDRIWGYLATGNYFQLLGIRPALGRFFPRDEDRVSGQAALAVLSHAAWRTRFAGDSAVVSRTVRINGLAHTVIGVAPPGFHGVELLYHAELWVPMMMQPQIEAWSWLETRRTYNAMLVGRRKEGVSPAQAEADLSRIVDDLAREFPTANAGLSLRLVRPGLIGDSARRSTTTFLGGIMLLAGLVLLAACANLAGLLSARTADRSREIAVRASIGASRARVLRQLTTETMILSLGAGTLAWIAAREMLSGLSRWELFAGLPLQIAVNPDARVFGFTALASLAIGLACGLLTTRHAWRVDLNTTLKGLSPGRRAARRWPVRDLLLAAQMALACVILTASAASIRGLSRAVTMPLAIEPRGLVVGAFDLGLSQRTEDQGRTLQRSALDKVAALPGIRAAAYASSVPLSIDQSTHRIFSDRESDFSASRAIVASYYNVSPGYFGVAGTPLIAGREFDWRDGPNAPPVAIVNETFAKRMFGTTDAVGRRLRYGEREPAIEIVGVVPDGKYVFLSEEPKPALFRSALQSYSRSFVLLVRSALPEAETAGQLRAAVTSLDPELPIVFVGGASRLIGPAFIPARLATAALGGFGVLALMLAVTGIYGTATHSVSRRVREIGLRTALGARPMQILRFVLGRTAMVLGVGAAIGLGLAVAAGRILAHVVHQASAHDPVVLGAAAASMVAVGIAAAFHPARRALSVGPLRALRVD